MENYTRIPDSIRKNKTLSPTEKLILGYLYTYQNKLVGKKVIPTGNYYYDTQSTLAEELGTYLREIERALFTLKQKGLIFQKKKGLVDGKSQFKNRKAIIMVDDNNPLPTIEVPNNVSNEVSKPVKEVVIIDIKTPIKKITNKLILIDILEEYTNEDGLKQGQNVDLRRRIDNDEFYYKEDLINIINEEIEYNNMCKNF